MKLGSSILTVLGALLLLPPSLRADDVRPAPVIARSAGELTVRSSYEDGALLELVHRAQLEATGAEASLAPPLPPGARIGPGAVTAADLLPLARGAARIVSVELTGAQIKDLLERTASRFSLYTYEHARPLLAQAVPDSLLDTAEGVSYELDLTRPAGERVLHLSFRGAPLDPVLKLRVAMDERRLGRGDLQGAPERAAVPLAEALVAHVRGDTLDDGFEHTWSLLPDYATLEERPLLDRMVRLGAVPKAEVHRLLGRQPARRGDLAYWLARSFGWREARLSGAFADVPDSLEPWLDGLLRRRILGGTASEEHFRPFAPVGLSLAFDWLEKAARHESYALDTPTESQSFRRGLLAGTSVAATLADSDSLTRGQVLGLVANARFPEIRVVATSDLHGALLPRDRGTGRHRGGAAALAAHIQRLRAANPDGTLLLDGGDMFQGTMISNLFHGRPVVEHMNRLGYTAAAIGNHEFDWSVDTLIARVKEMRFPALAANLVERRGGKRPWWTRSDTLFTRRGVRIALLGIAYPATPSVSLAENVASLRFLDDSVTAGRLVSALRDRKAEVVIGLSHVPATQDSAGRIHGGLARLAAGVPGVDLWLGGHSHTVVAGEVGGVLAMVPGSHGEWVGLVDLVVDPTRDRVVERRWRHIPTWTDEVMPDSATQQMVERWQSLLGGQASAVIGRNLRRLTKNRGGESPIGSLVADAMREATGAEIALQNNGGLRAELPEGAITRAALFEVIPFDNEIITLTLSGGEVKQTLEEGLAHERIVQVSGIRYRFDLGRPVGSRVTSLTDAAGNALDPGRLFRVACNDFMAQGGDDLRTLARGRDPEHTELDLREALERAIRTRGRSGSVLDYQGDGRVTREPGSKAPAREHAP
jgi:2',3'-cyclic-nucleotide 2'-phosphodiesterase (5'-nucleotidase family)